MSVMNYCLLLELAAKIADALEVSLDYRRNSKKAAVDKQTLKLMH
jgi:hypothetical protein